MTRAIFVLIGFALVAIAFIAGAQVADTREGLIAEVVTLFSGLGGVVLLLYGLVPKRRGRVETPVKPEPLARTPGQRTGNDLLLGGGGLTIALVLLGGLVLSGGLLWAALGAVLLIPMVAGCAYLLVTFARAPEKSWSIDLHRLFRSPTRD